MKKLLSVITAMLLLSGAVFGQGLPQNASAISHQGGTYYAAGYNWQARVISGNTATGSQAIIIAGNAAGGQGGLQLSDGTTIPLQVGFSTANSIIVDQGQGNQETVTPTAVSFGTCPAGNLGVGGSMQCVTVTASFSNTHGQSGIVADGSFGLGSAVAMANNLGGGIVVIDGVWSALGGTNALVAALTPFPLVGIEDLRSGSAQYWNAQPATASFIAAPAVLTSQAACDATHTFCSDANVVGTWANTGTLFGCITYVDIMGNESACSPTASFTNTNLKAIDVGAPAASTGAVGYAIYLSLSGGTYAQAFRVPLTSSICTLTKLETTTPACAVTNTTYGQTGSTFGANALFLGGAQIAATTVNTAMHFPVSGGISTAASNVGAVTAHTTYAYVPGTRLGAPFETVYTAFTAVATQATTVPGTMGSINLPPGFMNFINKTIRITGKFTTTQPGSTSEVFQVAWDADGTNTTTNPVAGCIYTNTSTGTNAVWNGTFTCLLTTVTTGATGTLMASGGLQMNLAAATTAGELYILPETAVAATGSVNLLSPNGSRLDIISTPTGSTQSATTLLSLVLEEVN